MKRLNVLILLNFIIMTTFNMAHPVTPKLITELNLPSYMFGVLFAVMAVANYVMSPIWGNLSDAKGRKHFLIIGVLGYGIAQLGFGISTNEISILIFRLLGGTFSVCYLTASLAYLTDLTSNENRVKYISYYSAAAALGSSVGAILGGTIGELNYKYSFYSQFILCIIIALILNLVIEKSVVNNDIKVSISLNHLKVNRKFFSVKTNLNTMMIVITLITISTTAYNSTISYYIEAVLKLPTSMNGIIMSIAGIIGLSMNVFVNPYLDKRFDDKRSMVIIVFVASISILSASLFGNLVFSAGFIVVFIMSSSLLVPIYQSMISKLANNNYGQVMGMQGSSKALGMIVGSLVSGIVFNFGEKLPFLLGGISTFIAFFILVRLFYRNKNN